MVLCLMFTSIISRSFARHTAAVVIADAHYRILGHDVIAALALGHIRDTAAPQVLLMCITDIKS